MPKRFTDGWVRIFDVPETARHPKGFTVYKIVSFVYHKSAPDFVTKYVTWKRFSELKKFHDYITRRNKEELLKDNVPKMTASQNYFKRMDKDIIANRQSDLLNLLEYVAKYPILITNDIFQKFFEESQFEMAEIDCNKTQLDIDYSDNLSDISDNPIDYFDINSNQTSSKIDEKQMKDMQINDDKEIPNDLLNQVEKKNETSDKILQEAEVYFTRALNYEIDGKFMDAFVNCKSGIACLLNGLKNDQLLKQINLYQQSFIKNKANRYINHAENLFKLHLQNNGNVSNNAHDNVSQKYIDFSNELILPKNVPFMVKMMKFYENENAYFFLLEYIRKGLLWNYLNEKFNWQNNNEKISTIKNVLQKENGEISEIIKQNKVEIDEIVQKSYNLLQSGNKSRQLLESAYKPLVPLNLIKKWIAQLLCSLEHLHKSGIIYKNLQPRKLLIDEKQNLILAFKFNFHDKLNLKQSNGLQNIYKAPELNGCHIITTAVDLWSVGVILFELLTGKKLEIENFEELLLNHDDSVSISESIPTDSQSLLDRLLVFQPENRITIDDIKQHAFFKDFDWISVEKCVY